MTPGLSVVVASIHGDGLPCTVASVRAAERRAAATVELIVAWQGDGDPPPLPGDTRIVRILPLGLSAARNAGLAHARAELVAFVDDDEVVEPRWVAGILEVFADPRVDAAFGQVLPADTRGVPYCVMRIETPVLMRGRRRAPWGIGTGGNMAFRRAALLGLGGFDVRLGAGTPARSGEDADVISRLQAAGAVIARWPEIVVRHPTKPAEEVRASRRPYGRGMGVLARRRLSPVLVWNFLSAAVWELYRVGAARDLARAAELGDTVRGWLAGVAAADAWDAPATLPARAPREVAAALGNRPVTGLPIARRGDLHLVYACGDDLVLHVRTGDPEPLARALAVQRALADHLGVARVRAAAHDGRASWVLEERLELRPLPRDPARWSGRACGWFAALARRGAGRVGDGDWWARASRTLPAAVPPAWATLVSGVLARLADLPAGPAHADPRPDTISLCGPDGIGVLGWEAAEADAPVGLDLVALTTRIAPDQARDEAIGGLLERREPGGAPVLATLSELGVARQAVPWLVAATLAHLVEREARRAATPGTPARPLAYRPLFDRLGPRLAAACGSP